MILLECIHADAGGALLWGLGCVLRMRRRYLAVLLFAALGFGQRLQQKTAAFQSHGTRVTIDEYDSRPPDGDNGTVILLYGSGGLQSNAIPYADQARRIARMGYWVCLPHYLDVTRGRANE